MRKEDEIVKEINERGEEYHKQSQVLAAPELLKMSAKIKELKQELSDTLSKGAKPCPNCGAKPIGMQRRKPVYENGLVKNPAVYEVGCIACAPFTDEVEGKKIQTSYSSWGNTPKEAVDNWNAKNWITKEIPKEELPK